MSAIKQPVLKVKVVYGPHFSKGINSAIKLIAKNIIQSTNAKIDCSTTMIATESFPKNKLR